MEEKPSPGAMSSSRTYCSCWTISGELVPMTERKTIQRRRRRRRRRGRRRRGEEEGERKKERKKEKRKMGARRSRRASGRRTRGENRQAGQNVRHQTNSDTRIHRTFFEALTGGNGSNVRVRQQAVECTVDICPDLSVARNRRIKKK